MRHLHSTALKSTQSRSHSRLPPPVLLSTNQRFLFFRHSQEMLSAKPALLAQTTLPDTPEKPSISGLRFAKDSMRGSSTKRLSGLRLVLIQFALEWFVPLSMARP